MHYRSVFLIISTLCPTERGDLFPSLYDAPTLFGICWYGRLPSPPLTRGDGAAPSVTRTSEHRVRIRKLSHHSSSNHNNYRGSSSPYRCSEKGGDAGWRVPDGLVEAACLLDVVPGMAGCPLSSSFTYHTAEPRQWSGAAVVP